MCQTPVTPLHTAPVQHTLPGLSSSQQRSSMETLGCETLQHSTLRGLIISPFRLNGKARNMLGSRCCFGAATEFRSPTGAWTPSAFGFLKAASPCPPTHTCSLTVRGAGTCHPQSLPLVGAVGSHVAQWGLQPPPRSRLSRQELCLCLVTLPLGIKPP